MVVLSDGFWRSHYGGDDDPDRVSMIDARLKPAITLQAATAVLTRLIQEFAKETPVHFPRQPGLRITAPVSAVFKARDLRSAAS